jgi:type II secretory pathway predicted ATPase ExeA
MPEPAATYWSYFGLRQAPFRAAAGSASYHLSPTHEEALARLHFLVENRRRLGLLLGDLGSGKTLLLTRFASEIRSQGIDAVFLPGFGTRDGELLSALLEGLSLGSRREEPERVLWGRLADHLVERRYQRTPAVLIVDDADAAREEALTAVVRILKLDAAAEPQITVVLSAEPRCASRLGARLLDMAELRIDLERWTPEETGEFVQQTLANAGHAGQLFEPRAVERLHELAGGRPRRVGQIADLALIAAAGQQRSSIDAATVETVFRELVSGH